MQVETRTHRVRSSRHGQRVADRGDTDRRRSSGAAVSVLDRHRVAARAETAEHGIRLVRATVEGIRITAAPRSVDRDGTVGRNT